MLDFLIRHLRIPVRWVPTALDPIPPVFALGSCNSIEEWNIFISNRLNIFSYCEIFGWMILVILLTDGDRHTVLASELASELASAVANLVSLGSNSFWPSLVALLTWMLNKLSFDNHGCNLLSCFNLFMPAAAEVDGDGWAVSSGLRFSIVNSKSSGLSFIVTRGKMPVNCCEKVFQLWNLGIKHSFVTYVVIFFCSDGCLSGFDYVIFILNDVRIGNS